MIDPEILVEFVNEATDMLNEVEPTLIELSQMSEEMENIDEELIHKTFRLFHSLKGNAGFLELHSVAALTHEAETLLDKIRNKIISLNSGNIDVICKAMDLLRAMIGSIEEKGTDEGFTDQIAELSKQLMVAWNPDAPIASAPAAVEPAAESAPPADTAVAGTAEFDMSNFITDEMKETFVKEGAEQLDDAEQAILTFQEADGDEKTEALKSAFRTIHSFKGNCGFMNISSLEKVSHRLETAIGEIREGRTATSSDNIQTILKTIDALKEGVVIIRDGEKSQILNSKTTSRISTRS